MGDEDEVLHSLPGSDSKYSVKYDQDGDLDLICGEFLDGFTYFENVNSVNTTLMLNIGTEDGMTTFQDIGPLGQRVLAGHRTSPATVDWNQDNIPTY